MIKKLIMLMVMISLTGIVTVSVAASPAAAETRKEIRKTCYANVPLPNGATARVGVQDKIYKYFDDSGRLYKVVAVPGPFRTVYFNNGTMRITRISNVVDRPTSNSIRFRNTFRSYSERKWRPPLAYATRSCVNRFYW